MQEEFDALQRNQTWELVPHPPRANIITGKWVFKHKLRSDGTLERYKARWVVRGFRQCAGVDFTDTFAPVDKPGTIRTVLHSPPLELGRCTRWTSPTPFFMDILRSKSTVSSPLGLLTPSILTVCACSLALYTG